MPNRVGLATTALVAAAGAALISFAAMPSSPASSEQQPWKASPVPLGTESLGYLHELLAVVVAHAQVHSYLSALSDEVMWFNTARWYTGVQQRDAEAMDNAKSVAGGTSYSSSYNYSNSAGVSQSSGSGDWQRVANCEEGGSNDATYGYYGITPSTWAAYGGTQYSPTAGGATQSEQIAIANAISGGYVPDANGCTSW